MMPWAHFAVAFLPYLAYRLLKYRALPSRRTTLFLLLATQLPDLIDKPLAWGLHLLPSGRSLAHSIFFAIPLVVTVGVLTWRRGRPAVGSLFAFAYLSHVFADVYNILLSVPTEQWSSTFLTSLYWPLLPVQPPKTAAFLPHFTRVDPARYGYVAIGLVLFGLLFASPEIRDALERHRPPRTRDSEDVATTATERRFDTE